MHGSKYRLTVLEMGSAYFTQVSCVQGHNQYFVYNNPIGRETSEDTTG